VLTLRGSDIVVVEVFLPERYSDVMTYADLDSINSKAISLNLVYKGVCDSSKRISLLLNPKYLCVFPPHHHEAS